MRSSASWRPLKGDQIQMTSFVGHKKGALAAALDAVLT